jgi:hypothetical protein
VVSYLGKLVAVVLAVSVVATVMPVLAHAGDQPKGKNCVGEEGGEARAAGDSGGGGGEEEEEEDEDAPPKFSAAFYRLVFTLDASLDGVDGKELPISIEEICDIPKPRAKEAAQLAGADGVALLRPRTQVFADGKQVTGKKVAAALDGADTATLRVRLARPRAWREDEDGNPVATFRTGRIEITD